MLQVPQMWWRGFAKASGDSGIALAALKAYVFLPCCPLQHSSLTPSLSTGEKGSFERGLTVQKRTFHNWYIVDMLLLCVGIISGDANVPAGPRPGPARCMSGACVPLVSGKCNMHKHFRNYIIFKNASIKSCVNDFDVHVQHFLTEFDRPDGIF